jgi:S-(hydroxymethyl)glutathione dehydrogenase/alcohol dehydrogenase
VKAAVLREVGAPMAIEELILDGPRANEVRIRVVGSGLCHSDYHFIIGDMPHPLPVVLGHEASGIITAIGADVGGFKVGDAVVTCFTGFCGACAQCQTGHSYRCDAKPARNMEAGEARLRTKTELVHQFGQLGGFAEEMVVHKSYVTKLPDAMPLDVACLLGCAVLTGVGAVINAAKVRCGETVAVIGCGGVGLNVVQGAKLAGASRIVAVDLNAKKLELAKRFGATDVVIGGEGAVEQVLELTKGGVDYAFEVIGNVAAMRQAFMMLRKGGAAVVVGLPKFGSDFAFPAVPFLRCELRVLSSMVGSAPHQIEIPRYGELYLKGALKLDELVSQRIPLDAINRGYEELAAGDIARSVIVFDKAT